MENTVNAGFECTYTLSHVLSLGHNCMLMIAVTNNSAFLLLCASRFVPITACAVQRVYQTAAVPPGHVLNKMAFQLGEVLLI